MSQNVNTYFSVWQSPLRTIKAINTYWKKAYLRICSFICSVLTCNSWLQARFEAKLNGEVTDTSKNRHIDMKGTLFLLKIVVLSECLRGKRCSNKKKIHYRDICANSVLFTALNTLTPFNVKVDSPSSCVWVLAFLFHQTKTKAHRLFNLTWYIFDHLSSF